jgi:hypothetical protein
MYRILGGDQKQYGPVSADEVRRWIAEHRLHANSLVQAEGTTDWKPLSLFPEFSSTLASVSTPAPLPISVAPVRQENGMATAGVLLSSFGFVCCCSPAVILGIIFSFIGLSRANRDPAHSGKEIAIAGIVIGFIALIGNVIAFVAGLFGGLIDEISKH